jgi:hypothetical protein
MDGGANEVAGFELLFDNAFWVDPLLYDRKKLVRYINVEPKSLLGQYIVVLGNLFSVAPSRRSRMQGKSLLLATQAPKSVVKSIALRTTGYESPVQLSKCMDRHGRQSIENESFGRSAMGSGNVPLAVD